MNIPNDFQPFDYTRKEYTEQWGKLADLGFQHNERGLWNPIDRIQYDIDRNSKEDLRKLYSFVIDLGHNLKVNKIIGQLVYSEWIGWHEDIYGYTFYDESNETVIELGEFDNFYKFLDVYNAKVKEISAKNKISAWYNCIYVA